MNNGILIFFTSTILNWQNLLSENYNRDIVMNALQYLVKNNKVKLYAYVIMPNHIHLLLQPLNEQTKNENLQHSLLSYTAHQFKKFAIENGIDLKAYEVKDSDRQYQFWERNPLSIEIYSKEVAEQKLNYIHNNPWHEKWKLFSSSITQSYSSEMFYQKGIDEHNMLTHYMEYFE